MIHELDITLLVGGGILLAGLARAWWLWRKEQVVKKDIQRKEGWNDPEA